MVALDVQLYASIIVTGVIHRILGTTYMKAPHQELLMLDCNPISKDVPLCCFYVWNNILQSSLAIPLHYVLSEFQ